MMEGDPEKALLVASYKLSLTMGQMWPSPLQRKDEKARRTMLGEETSILLSRRSHGNVEAMEIGEKSG